MKKLLIAASLMFAFGCGKKGIDAKLDELAKIKDAMCKCTDKACADAQHEAYIAWKKGNKDEAKPDKDQMEKYETIRKDMMDCRHKLDGAGGGDQPAPGGAPPAGGAPAPAPAPAPATP
jgi:hypothetical protein